MTFGENREKQIAALFHLFGVHLEEFRTHPETAVYVRLEEKNLRIAIAFLVVVSGQGGDLKALVIEIFQACEHFHGREQLLFSLVTCQSEGKNIMGFKMYRFEAGENLSETYRNPEPLVLSGFSSPLAGYVKAVQQDVWSLSEVELTALAKPGANIHSTAILFEAGSDQPGHITLYRLVSLHGRSTDDTTEIIAHFKILLNNANVGDLAAFRTKFTADSSIGKPDIYENLKLSGGTRSGTWRWMEIEQILTAGVITPK